MKLTQIQNNYLYEGLDANASKSMMLWETAGIRLKEAALTADQIQALFAQVEAEATAGGDNRTLIGQGKDAADAVSKAWEDLKTKIQNSAPIANVDATYDDAVAKIEAGLGGPDNAINKVIQKYRKFAKEHPVAQGFIYAALIAAAGISGAGLGGAAVLGLLKMADKLLQGEKFSSAAYQGAKTGAMAYGASKLGDYLKGKPEGDATGAADVATSSIAAVRKQASDEAMKAVQDAIANGADPRLQGELADVAQAVLEKYSTLQGGPLSVQTAESLAQKIAMQATRSLGSTAADAASNVASTVDTDAAFNAMGQANQLRQALRGESVEGVGKKLSEGQVYLIFNRVVTRNDYMMLEGRLMEGPMDAIKGGIGKAVDWAKTKGKNLTTKVTADKLNQAWQAAGSPMDSEAVAGILKSAGVNDTVVKKVYSDLKIPTGGAAAKGATLDFDGVMKLINTLPADRKARLLKSLLKKSVSEPAPAATPAPTPEPDGRIEPTM